MNETPLTTEILKKTMANLPKDPLLEKGIEKDWVCVINPSRISDIKQIFKDNPPIHRVSPLYELDHVMGRRVFIINEAPSKIEYMPEKVMRDKYAEHFQRQHEAMTEEAQEILDEMDDD